MHVPAKWYELSSPPSVPSPPLSTNRLLFTYVDCSLKMNSICWIRWMLYPLPWFRIYVWMCFIYICDARLLIPDPDPFENYTPNAQLDFSPVDALPKQTEPKYTIRISDVPLPALPSLLLLYLHKFGRAKKDERKRNMKIYDLNYWFLVFFWLLFCCRLSSAVASERRARRPKPY